MAETSWSLSWADDPPVTRTVDHSPEHILDLARDNAINRSHTSLISEVRLTINGYPAREFSARNTGGGILNARLIYTGQRMYMLTAAFPAERRSNEKEVAHFFDSLSLINSDRVSESLPPAEIPASR